MEGMVGMEDTGEDIADIIMVKLWRWLVKYDLDNYTPSKLETTKTANIS